MKPESELFEGINLLNEGKRLLQEFKFGEAHKFHEECIPLPPSITPQILLGIKLNHLIALYKCCHYQQAIKIANEILSTILPYSNDVNVVGAKSYLAMLEMIDGDYITGFRALASFADAYVGVTQKRKEYRAIKRWKGEDIRGRKIAIVSSLGGVGDCMAFIRFAIMLANRGGLVTLEIPEALIDIEILGAKIDKSLSLNGSTNETFDYYCHLICAPSVMKVEATTLPINTYMQARDAYLDEWRERLGLGHRMRVGLCIGGNKSGPDKERFIDVELLKPVLEIDAEFHSLQVEHCKSDIEFLESHGIINHAANIKTMADTAGLINCMDLVISVDTSVAHLAGAMGRPLWVLLPKYKNFYWHEERPWYPQAKLFRQVHEGSYREPIKLVSLELARLVNRIGGESAS